MKLPLYFILAVTASASLIPLPYAEAQADERNLLMPGFRDLVIKANIDVELTTGGNPKAVVTGDRKDIERVKLERNGNQMVITLKPQQGTGFRKPSSAPLKLVISNHSLENIDMRGNGNLNASSLDNRDIARINMTGNGNITIASAKAKALNISLLGNGKITIASGSALNGRVQLQGNGAIDVAGLTYNKVTLYQSGEGSSSANVKEAASISSNGNGNITISGKGTCFVKNAGSTTIECAKYAP